MVEQARTTKRVGGMDALRVSLQKTEVMLVGRQREELNKTIYTNLCTLEEWLRRTGNQRWRCDVIYKQ